MVGLGWEGLIIGRIGALFGDGCQLLWRSG